MAHEQQALQVSPFDLGGNNIGPFGPTEHNMARMPEYVADLAKPAYSKPVTNEWICVDGRVSAQDEARIERGEVVDAVPAQIAGAKLNTDVAAAMMAASAEVKPRSVVTEEKAKEGQEDGQMSTLHGDETKADDGCKASLEIRGVFRYNAQNIDTVAPIVWSAVTAFGLDKVGVTQEDVTESIQNSGLNAENDELWDVTPAEVNEIARRYGHGYTVLLGQHGELAERIDATDDGGFDKPAFVHDHNGEQAFAASFGRYKKVSFENGPKRGLSERQIGIQVMRAFAFNIGISKILKNDRMPVAVVTPVA